MEEVDVLVIGAGPAGSCAAEAAAKGGAKVLMVDRRDKVGHPVHCAGFLHKLVVGKLAIPSNVISQEVRAMETYIRGRRVSSMRAPGCILERETFDVLLSNRAMGAGARLLLGTEAKAPIVEGADIVGARMSSKDGNGPSAVRARVIIGADGPFTSVGRWISCERHSLLVARQLTVELKEPLQVTEVYLDPDYAAGYGWLFPKGEVANVGVGVDTRLGIGSKKALEALMERLADRVGDTLSKTGGHIPVGGPGPTVAKNVVLVGDAAGLTHPITGGGIHQAVASGEFAGRAASRLIRGEEKGLAGYEREWRALFAHGLEHAVTRRREMVEWWTDDSSGREEFSSLMGRCWIGSKGYGPRNLI